MPAKEEAELVVGGNRIGTGGNFMEPTVFVNPKPDAEIYKSEVSGPVAVIKTFDTEAKVIQAANDTEYGLMARVYTWHITRALRVSARIESGVVGVNCVSMVGSILYELWLGIRANSGRVVNEHSSSERRRRELERVWRIREFMPISFRFYRNNNVHLTMAIGFADIYRAIDDFDQVSPSTVYPCSALV